jgi:hypothetical protein
MDRRRRARWLVGLVAASLLLVAASLLLATPLPGSSTGSPAAAGRAADGGVARAAASATPAGVGRGGGFHLLACAAGTDACPVRISFAAGAYSGQSRSVFTGAGQERWFVVWMRAGQEMIVFVVGPGATRGAVIFPDGEQDGQPGGRVFDGIVPVTGDARIRVTESSMAEPWRGAVDVVVLIV